MQLLKPEPNNNVARKILSSWKPTRKIVSYLGYIQSLETNLNRNIPHSRILSGNFIVELPAESFANLNNLIEL